MNDQTNSTCAFCSLVNSITDWMAHPFSGQGTAFQWVLTIGLLIVALWFWQVVLLDLREEL